MGNMAAHRIVMVILLGICGLAYLTVSEAQGVSILDIANVQQQQQQQQQWNQEQEQQERSKQQHQQQWASQQQQGHQKDQHQHEHQGYHQPLSTTARRLLQTPADGTATTAAAPSAQALQIEDPVAEPTAADTSTNAATPQQLSTEIALGTVLQPAAEPAATDPGVIEESSAASSTATPLVDIMLEPIDPDVEVEAAGLALHQGSAVAIDVNQQPSTPVVTKSFQRCGTPKLSEAVKAAADAEVQAHFKGVIRPADVAVAAPSGPISVHWHILVNVGISRGMLTDQQINAQMAIMNAAYAPAGIQFVSASRTRYGVSSRYFTASMWSSSEISFKRWYRRGTARDLNIYTWAPLDGSLGWASFPLQYTANPKQDGVVIHWTTLPGVCAANPTACSSSLLPYTLGDTTVHEVRAFLSSVTQRS